VTRTAGCRIEQRDLVATGPARRRRPSVAIRYPAIARWIGTASCVESIYPSGAPPSSVMNSRRFTRSPRRRGDYPAKFLLCRCTAAAVATCSGVSHARGAPFPEVFPLEAFCATASRGVASVRPHGVAISAS